MPTNRINGTRRSDDSPDPDADDHDLDPLAAIVVETARRVGESTGYRVGDALRADRAGLHGVMVSALGTLFEQHQRLDHAAIVQAFRAAFDRLQINTTHRHEIRQEAQAAPTVTVEVPTDCIADQVGSAMGAGLRMLSEKDMRPDTSAIGRALAPAYVRVADVLERHVSAQGRQAEEMATLSSALRDLAGAVAGAAATLAAAIMAPARVVTDRDGRVKRVEKA